MDLLRNFYTNARRVAKEKGRLFDQALNMLKFIVITVKVFFGMKNKVSKYDIHWQVVRVSVKGKHNHIPYAKAYGVCSLYYNEFPNISRKERVLNWLKGLKMGYKDSEKKEQINQLMQIVEGVKAPEIYEPTANSLEAMRRYPDSKLLAVYKDLYRTNEKWLKKGYIHPECNKFIDNLYLTLDGCSIPDRYSFSRLEILRSEASQKPNTHKFLF